MRVPESGAPSHRPPARTVGLGPPMVRRLAKASKEKKRKPSIVPPHVPPWGRQPCQRKVGAQVRS
eukprot:15076817-Alexandrium_andersonii.AAC.1